MSAARLSTAFYVMTSSKNRLSRGWGPTEKSLLSSPRYPGRLVEYTYSRRKNGWHSHKYVSSMSFTLPLAHLFITIMICLKVVFDYRNAGVHGETLWQFFRKELQTEKVSVRSDGARIVGTRSTFGHFDQYQKPPCL